MKIVHVCAGAEASNGAAVVAAGLAREEARRGFEVVFASTSLPPGTAEVDLAGVRKVVFGRSRIPLLSRLSFSSGMMAGLGRVCRDADVVHVHCQWTFPVWWGARCARRALIISPHGSFDPVRLAFGAFRKRLVGWIDRACIRKADVVHATSAAEARWIRAFEPGAREVVVAPPGVDVPERLPGIPERGGRLRVLYLGRSHPLKGLDMLREAVRGLDVELREESSLFGAAREAAFEWCDVLCLPTRSENYGLVVAEALARGRPVIVTRAAPWEGVIAHGCGWWPEATAAAIGAALADAAGKTRQELRAMGAAGRAWMESERVWRLAAVSGDMLASAAKERVRREMRRLRKGVDASWKAQADAAASSLLSGRADAGGHVVAVYLAAPGEIDIDAFVRYALGRGFQVAAPRWNGLTYELARVSGLDGANLRRGPMGIREPAEASVVRPEDVGLWIVPGLAFTRDGRRLGYGGGWYDRLLAKAAPGAVKTGVAYPFQIVDDLPSEARDMRVDDVVVAQADDSRRQVG